MFTCFVVLVLYFFLCFLDRTRHDLGVYILSLFHTETVHNVPDLLSSEDAQQVVIETEEELTLTRVSLAAGTSSELVVDTA